LRLLNGEHWQGVIARALEIRSARPQGKVVSLLAKYSSGLLKPEVEI
jgi:hypothetical protein